MECTGTRFRKDGFEFPCGQCIVCRLRVQRTWVARILLEQALHPDSSFVTLTYDDDHYPGMFVKNGVEYPAGSVNPRDLQLWFKRLRKAAPGPIRYVAVGEYGEDKWRPHYHVALFGSGSSELVSSTWGKGHVLVKGIGPESAAYIVSYCLKRRNTDERCEGRYPEFKLQSLRPAIGLRTSEGLRIPQGSEVQGVRINNRIYPLGRFIRSKLRAKAGLDSEDATALRHRVAKYALVVRVVSDHERKVENAKTFTSSVLSKRREKQSLL